MVVFSKLHFVLWSYWSHDDRFFSSHVAQVTSTDHCTADIIIKGSSAILHDVLV